MRTAHRHDDADGSMAIHLRDNEKEVFSWYTVGEADSTGLHGQIPTSGFTPKKKNDSSANVSV